MQGLTQAAYAADTPSLYSQRAPTQRQLYVLQAVDQCAVDGKPITFRRLAMFLACRSLRTITEHVHALRRRGLVAQTWEAYEDEDGVHGLRAKWGSIKITKLGREKLHEWKPPTTRPVIYR